MGTALSLLASSADPQGQQTPDATSVFVVGPSSSGKTTLCTALVDRLQLPSSRHIKEVARGVMKAHGFSRDTVKTYAMQHAIMVAQLKAEEAVLQLGPGRDDQGGVRMLSDRSALDPIVYASTAGVPGAHAMRQRLLAEPALQAVLPSYREALFVVLSPVPEWLEDDGVRSLDDPANYHTQLCDLLTELGMSFIEIGGDMKDLTTRVDFVLGHLRRR